MNSSKDKRMSQKVKESRLLVTDHINKIMPLLERPEGDKNHYPFLSVSHGNAAYNDWFCVWDHHHMALRFAYAGKPEYLKYQVENAFSYQESSDFTPNSISIKDGPQGSASNWHAQPFIAQAAYNYLNLTSDLKWGKRIFSKLENYLNYYKNNLTVSSNGIYCWGEPYMSGIDSDVATSFFQPQNAVSPDLSSFIVLELRAAAMIQKKLGNHKKFLQYSKEAKELTQKINTFFWNESAQSYSARNIITGEFIFRFGNSEDIGKFAFQSCSNLIPLYASVASKERASTVIEKYLLSEKHFLSQYGIRSLSKSSEFYNNGVWANPPRFGNRNRLTNSNWQGPIWVITNYFAFHSLLNYGYISEASDLENRLIKLLATHLEYSDSWAENYCAETGQPLYAKNFGSWNILSDVMHDEVVKDEYLNKEILLNRLN
jgi:putative isomerase